MYRSLGRMYRVTPGKIIIQGVPVTVDPIDLEVPVEQVTSDFVAEVKPHANEIMASAEKTVNAEVSNLKYWALGAAAGILLSMYFVVRLANRR